MEYILQKADNTISCLQSPGGRDEESEQGCGPLHNFDNYNNGHNNFIYAICQPEPDLIEVNENSLKAMRGSKFKAKMSLKLKAEY